jgi:hypothetical protein
MTNADVQRWLDRYIAAWASYDEAAIGELFAEDAEYRYHPWDDPIRGRDAIVRAWVAPEGDASSRDAPDSWSAHYDVWALDGERATAVGESRYTNPDGSFRALYFNNWLLRFDAHGRCVEFVEYFMELPERLRAGR